MSLIGKEIGAFSTKAYHEDDFKTIVKDDVLGHWAVFFFYPADFSFVCPTELKELADRYEEFKEADCEVYSVSCDTHFAHKAWHDASEAIKAIRFPMLADPSGKLAKDFGVMDEDKGFAERGSFIVNPQGKICAYEVSAANVGRSAAELLRKLQACQFVAKYGDRVCPAAWTPGDDTLKPDPTLVGKL
ncbi:redoxin domain-containing protein [Synergistes jonesii]|uniref:redoxin domain-containing protein n=1 Tax=Synergistes jonesii TaxID=2754 RepID=UPI00248E4C7E|nr:redoxin domain-containing protein [Synergistes jonesii]